MKSQIVRIDAGNSVEEILAKIYRKINFEITYNDRYGRIEIFLSKKMKNGKRIGCIIPITPETIKTVPASVLLDYLIRAIGKLREFERNKESPVFNPSSRFGEMK